MIKIILKQILNFYFNIYNTIILVHYNILSTLDKRLKVKILNGTVSFLDSEKKDIVHQTSKTDLKFNIFTPSGICFFRADTFSIKEPETLLWIEEFGSGSSTLFDIGANIGLYTIYHSLLNGGKSYAFEPSFFNLKQLVRNVNINNCENDVVIIANPLTSTNKIQKFKYGSTEEGGALSGFGVNYGFDGKNIESKVSNNVIGFSLDYLISTGIIKDIPDLVKIDVDGIEHIILEGAVETISSDRCKSILVEVNSDFREQEEKVHKILKSCGYEFIKKYYPNETNIISEFANSGNEIWKKC